MKPQPSPHNLPETVIRAVAAAQNPGIGEPDCNCPLSDWSMAEHAALAAITAWEAHHAEMQSHPAPITFDPRVVISRADLDRLRAEFTEARKERDLLRADLEVAKAVAGQRSVTIARAAERS